MTNRYAKQINFHAIQAKGQKLLASSKVAIIGCGALGTVVTNSLVRAGVGHVRIVDRDYVELGNLHRQILFDEEDATNYTPKAIAAKKKLQGINSEVEVEALVMDVNSSTIQEILQDIQLIIDCTDNFQTRYLINDAAFAYKIPWVYGGVIGSSGIMYPFIPGGTPCLRCFMPEPPSPGSVPTCDTTGVINTITGVIGNLQATEALKYLTNQHEKVGRKVFYIDIWERSMEGIDLQSKPDCPCCKKGEYHFLEDKTSTATFICGNNTVQVDPRLGKRIDLVSLRRRLNKAGITTSVNPFILTVTVDGYELRVFSDGRAMIKNASTIEEAKSIYARIIGL